jgi:vancomycin resistance protein VanW
MKIEKKPVAPAFRPGNPNLKVGATWMALIFTFSIGAAGYAYIERPFSKRMSAYVTDLGSRTPEQRRNILKAAATFQGRILQPGEIFSLNETAGPYSAERGYLPERSFRGKAVVDSDGGGVCQVASTLYNAALTAGLPILERVPHSQAVSSVPPGRDATVAYGVADLKFSNGHPFPIKLISREQGDHLLIEIWGKEPPHGTEPR